MGVTLGSPSIVVEGGGSQSPIMFARAQTAMASGGASVQQGQLSVSVQIQVTYNIQ